MNSVGQTGSPPLSGCRSKKHQRQRKKGQKPIVAATHARRDRRLRLRDKELGCCWGEGLYG